MVDAFSLKSSRAVDAPARRAERPRQRLEIPPYVGWIVPVLILLAWQAAATFGLLSSSVLPAPSQVAKVGFASLVSGDLGRSMEVSALRATAGLLVGGAIGFAFGLSNALSRWSFALTDTGLQMIRNVPHLSLIPLVILWFGIDEGAKLFLVALGAFFPIYLNTLHGIRSVDPQLVEMGRSYGLSPRTVLWRIVFPGALPSIFVGLRYALGVTWLTLIVAETIAAQTGIGYMAMQAREFMQTDLVVFAILIYALLGKAADSTVRLLERRTLRWNPAYHKDQTS